ncbi:MAG: SIMPL domain-containing protein [Mucinivorans sp.]
MKKLFFVTLIASMALLASAQQVQEKPYIEVGGKASRLVEPNRVEVRITLSEAVSKGKVKLAELESQLATALKQAEVDASKQLVVISQSSTSQKRATAYQYKTYLLTLTSADEVATVFEAFAANSVQNASISRMYNTDQEKIVKELQIEAMKNSQQTALNLTSAIGQTIAGAIQIQYWSNDIPPVGYSSDNMLRSKAVVESEELPSDLKLRPIDVRCSVTVRYALLTLQ